MEYLEHTVSPRSEVDKIHIFKTSVACMHLYICANFYFEMLL